MILIWIQFPQYVRGKQLEEELDLARKVQAHLLPPSNTLFGVCGRLCRGLAGRARLLRRVHTTNMEKHAGEKALKSSSQSMLRESRVCRGKPKNGVLTEGSQSIPVACNS